MWKISENSQVVGLTIMEGGEQLREMERSKRGDDLSWLPEFYVPERWECWCESMGGLFTDMAVQGAARVLAKSRRYT